MHPRFGMRQDRQRRRARSCRPLFERMESRLQLSAVLWTGNGGDNNWDDPANWSTDALPGPGDDVTIDVSASVVHSDAVADSINSLTSTQPLTLSGGTLSIASASSTTGPLAVDGGTLTGTGDLTVGGLLTLTAGTISGSGTVVADAGIAINPGGVGFTLDGRTLTNAAGQTATWTGTGGALTMSDAAVFNNLGAFAAQVQGSVTQGAGASASFVDEGSFTTATGGGELDFVGLPFDVPGGTVAVQSGTLGLQGGGTETGASFSIGAGATLDFAGSTAFSADSGTTFSGAGNLTKDGPTTLTLSGESPSFTGPTTVNAGTLLVNGSMAGTAVSVLSGATLGGTGTVGAVSTTGGTLQPGNNPGILVVDGDVTLDPSSTFAAALDGPTPGTGYDQLNASGTVNLNGSTLVASLGFTPSAQSFTIIRSAAPIVGTFQGRPPGSTLLLGGRLFTISYDAGNGHDVALTLVSPVVPPQILSGGSATFAAGTAGRFTASAIGAPVPAWTETGALPSGVTFVDNSDGTATLAGTPAPGTGGTYHLTLTASNGVGAGASQAFSLTVIPAVSPTASPTITSANVATFQAGQAGSFLLAATGSPTPTISEAGALPPGLTFVDNGNGTATIAGTPAAGVVGVYHLTITAANGVGAGVTEDLALNVVIGTPPEVVSLQRVGVKPRLTRIVLSFNEPMDAALAELTSNYAFRPVVRGRAVTRARREIRVTSAVYDAASRTVTLRTAKPLGLHQVYQITANGLAPSGLANVSGVLLDGQGNGQPGSSFVLTFAGRASLRGVPGPGQS